MGPTHSLLGERGHMAHGGYGGILRESVGTDGGVNQGLYQNEVFALYYVFVIVPQGA